VSKNAREINEYIEEIYWGSRKRVLLLGHSKGGVDAAAALSLYWPQLKDKVVGLVLAQLSILRKPRSVVTMSGCVRSWRSWYPRSLRYLP
jgi:alpha-beta hydrolase superfamily lysophospholipase